MVIYFYSTIDEYGCFSNFSGHGVKLDGKYWPTCEHYFQAQKFVGNHDDYVEKIRKANKPHLAKRLGRSRKHKLRKNWEAIKDGIMRKCVFCKFETHEEVREILLATDDEKLVESAPGDYYWGCGADGSGKNMLGKILMEVRKQLREK